MTRLFSLKMKRSKTTQINSHHLLRTTDNQIMRFLIFSDFDFFTFIDLKARAQAERNMQNEVNQIIGRSNLLKFVSGMVSSIKIVISSVFLSNFSEACGNAEITDWLILMMLHDCLNVFYVAFYMIYSKFFANRRSILDEYEHQIRQQYQPLGEDGSNVQINQNNEQHQDLVESQCKFLLVLKELNKM